MLALYDCVAEVSSVLGGFSVNLLTTPAYVSCSLQDGGAVFAASYHIIKESASFSRQDRGQRARGALKAAKSGSGGGAGGLGGGGGSGGGGETFQGRFTWRIEHFTRLKDLLKKRKITGLCIKSRRFAVGGRDCRLIVYPRGASPALGHPFY